jgi:hypothetical protein
MKKIDIRTYATWISETNIFGTHTTPLLLQVEIHNNTSKDVIIRGICISAKSNFLLFNTSKDILRQDKNYIVNAKSKFSFQFDIRHILTQYSADKKFTVKIFSDIGNYESDKLTVNMLNKVKSAYT